MKPYRTPEPQELAESELMWSRRQMSLEDPSSEGLGF